MNRRTVTPMYGLAVCGVVLSMSLASALADAQSVDNHEVGGATGSIDGDAAVGGVAANNQTVDASTQLPGDTPQGRIDAPEAVSTNSTPALEKVEKPPLPPRALGIVVNP